MEEHNEPQTSTAVWVWIVVLFLLAFAALVLAIVAMTNSAYGFISVNIYDPGNITATTSGGVTFDGTKYTGLLNFARVTGANNASIDVSSWKPTGYKTLRVINQSLTGTLKVTGFTTAPSNGSVVNLQVGEYVDFRANNGGVPVFIGVSSTQQVTTS